MANLSKLLRNAGATVEHFERTSESIQSLSSKGRAFFSGIWSPRAALDYKHQVAIFEPDIVHIHNLFPLISPSVLAASAGLRIPVVMTAHNYRLLCPTGLMFNSGGTCDKCVTGSELSCIRENCTGNRLKSIGYATRNWVGRRTQIFQRAISDLICLTSFQRAQIERLVPPFKRLHVIPNCVSGEPSRFTPPGKYVGFVGRLSIEKGIAHFIDAARSLPHVEFRIAGAPDPLSCGLSLPRNVAYDGFLDAANLKEFIQRSRIIVMPSLFYEGFPMAALDAMAGARPIVAYAIGALPEVVIDGHTGVLVPQGNVTSLSSAIQRLYFDPNTCEQMGRQALELVTSEYSPQAFLDRTLAVYHNAISKLMTK